MGRWCGYVMQRVGPELGKIGRLGSRLRPWSETLRHDTCRDIAAPVFKTGLLESCAKGTQAIGAHYYPS